MSETPQAQSPIDHRHLETIARILEAIAPVEANVARAIVACEDAMVALALGSQLGLSPKQVARHHDLAMADVLAEPGKLKPVKFRVTFSDDEGYWVHLAQSEKAAGFRVDIPAQGDTLKALLDALIAGSGLL